MVSENHNSQALPAAHMLSIARGTMLALLMLISAHPTAILFGVPQFAGSFIAAASIPFLSSFSHLGIKQVQREYVYLPDTLAVVFANLAAVLMLVLAIALFRDHRAIIASFMTEAIVYVVVSHALARERYQITTDRVMLRAALKFGLPLLLNGIGLAIIAQLDRVVVGHWFGVNILASYAVILSISITPVGLILRVFGTAALSYLISTRERHSIAARNYHFLVFFFGLIAVSYMIFVATTIDILTPVLFGRKYTINPHVHVVIVAIVFLRVLCAGAPTNQLLATSRTRELAIINLARASGLLIGMIFMFFWPNFTVMLLGFLIGDLVTFVLFFGLSSARITANNLEAITDLAASFISALTICGVMLAAGIIGQARVAVFVTGLLAIATQILIGLRKNGPARVVLGSKELLEGERGPGG
jgi:O-antigen/teichoic acid export membrane protein